MTVAEIETLRAWFGSGAWCVDFARTAGRTLAIGGWIVSADARDAIEVRVNGRPLDWLTSRIRLPGLAAPFSFIPNAEYSGFRGRATLTEDDVGAGEIVAECCDAHSGRALWPAQRVIVPLPGARDAHLPIPEPRRIVRVTGSDSMDLFRLQGATIASSLVGAMARQRALPVEPVRARVLDWGVGCGRVARFLLPSRAFELCGVDVDGDNVDWCRSNLPGRYHVAGLEPPLDFADSSFDVVFGISVLTHLREDAALSWLDELARVLRPGGIALLSVHGVHAACRALRGKSIQAFGEAGFLFSKTPHALDAIIGDPTYYGTTFHTEPYLRRICSPRFDLNELVPAGIGNHQDLVVLRKRS